jgi:two-component system phosphate regulon response regulator PhoB
VRCVLVPSGPGTAVELHTEQGPVFSASRPDDHGCSQRSRIPAPAAASRRGPPARSALKPFALIVEDEQDTADAYREPLRLTGVRALTVPNGREALRRAEELLPDLIILDYRLPDLHGRELCRQLRANSDTMRVPILVVTASPQDNADSDCPDVVLTKPCPAADVSRRISLLLRRVMPTQSRPPASAA